MDKWRRIKKANGNSTEVENLILKTTLDAIPRFSLPAA